MTGFKHLRTPWTQTRQNEFPIIKRHVMTEDRASIALRDRHFAHAQTAGGFLPWPELPFRWDRTGAGRAVTVYTDTSLAEARREARGQVAWLLESPQVSRRAYAYARREAGRFERVLTFSQGLLEGLPQSRFVPLGGCWIEREDWGVHRKSRGLSAIASAKRGLAGQKLRHRLIARHRSGFDAVLGGGYRHVPSKLEGLREFRYTLAIENCRENFYFSEKLIDAFLTGTVPVYWGCPSIGLFFDRDGMIEFRNAREFARVLPTLGEADYARRLPAVRRNFELAQNYVYPEKHVWAALRELAGQHG